MCKCDTESGFRFSTERLQTSAVVFLPSFFLLEKGKLYHTSSTYFSLSVTDSECMSISMLHSQTVGYHFQSRENTHTLTYDIQTQPKTPTELADRAFSILLVPFVTTALCTFLCD